MLAEITLHLRKSRRQKVRNLVVGRNKNPPGGKSRSNVLILLEDEKHPYYFE
jgi:hypothetical protein